MEDRIERKVVLVVDDDLAVRNSHKFALELEGFEARIYEGPVELLQDEEAFSVGCCLIVNYQMPAMNGLDLVARLRDRGFAMPAILVTGHSSHALRRRAAAEKVTVVEKPFLGSRLIECIRNVIA